MARCLMLMSILFFMLAAPAKGADRGFFVYWDTGKIYFRDPEMNLFHGQATVPFIKLKDRSSKPVVPCFFHNMQTLCRMLRKEKKSEPYGSNLEFSNPIAILLQDNDTVNLPDKITPSFIASLPDVVISRPPKSARQKLANGPNVLGFATESHAYSPVDGTTGGDVALAFWKGQIGVRPNRDCLSEDYCSVVLPAQWKNSEAIAQCEIMNTKIGIGLPFNCNLVAIKRGQWYVFSYDSPVQCDGCGAAEGATCFFETNVSLNVFVSAVQNAMKKGLTNIDLKVISQNKRLGITLSGQNNATDSRFFAGYYDKSYAVYTIKESKAEGDQPREITMTGIFNLMISADPTVSSVNYREFGTDKRGDVTNLEWFQERVLEILKVAITREISGKMTCEVMPIQ